MTDLNIPANLVSIILDKQISTKSTWIIDISKEERVLNYALLDGGTGFINFYQFLHLCREFIVAQGFGISLSENEKGIAFVISKGGLIQKSFSLSCKDKMTIEATLWVVQTGKLKSRRTA